jgi:hypothetical protein
MDIYIYILGGPPRPQALGEDVGVGFFVFEKMTSLIFFDRFLIYVADFSKYFVIFGYI